MLVWTGCFSLNSLASRLNFIKPGAEIFAFFNGPVSGKMFVKGNNNKQKETYFSPQTWARPCQVHFSEDAARNSCV